MALESISLSGTAFFDQRMTAKSTTNLPMPAPTSATTLPMISNPSFHSAQPMPKPTAAPTMTQPTQTRIIFQPAHGTSPFISTWFVR